jgi:hypothetical protein
MWFTTAGGSTGGLWFKSSDSSLYASVGSVTGSTGFAVVTGRWYRVDLKLNVIADPWLCDVMIDGNALGQASSSTTASTISLVRLGFSTSDTFDIFYDDIVISKTTADYPIGAGYIHHFVPTSDGTHNIAGTGDFQRGNTGVDILNATTTAYQLIDDIPLPSGAVAEADCWRGVAPANPASDYVEVKFGPAPGIPTPTVAPRAVEFILAHHQISTTVGQMAVNVFDGGSLSTVFDTGSAAGVTTYRYARKNYITGGTWHIGGADSGDFGNLRTRFVGIDCNPDQCLDAIMIEAEFDEFRHRQEDIQQPYFGKTLIAPSGQKNNSRVT